MKIVLQKLIASSGKYSRRKAEEIIRSGMVSVNDNEALLGQKADPEKDIIKINGRVVSINSEMVYVKFNKPVGFVCTTAQFTSERNIFELINIKEKIFPVGRLDKNSRGLMLLTNDGDLTQKLTHPRFEHEKIYEARISFVAKNINNINLEKEISFKQLIKAMEGGIDIGEGDGIARAKKVEFITKDFFRIILSEGKKRQLRRMFAALGFKILDLKRIEIAGLRLNNLAEGSWQYLTDQELRDLKNITS